MTSRLRVAILGATGTVGQRFVQLLEGHPRFIVSALAASDRSVGKPYAEACLWRLPGEMPEGVRGLAVQPPDPPLDCDLVLSSLPGEVAREIEGCWAAAGFPVISNSSAYRMAAEVPLVIPEVNPDHLRLLDGRKGKGFIVTNPNCSAIGIGLALAPLQRDFGIAACVVTTLQAISGAGYPGVSAMDITDNVVPFIAGEEEKIERETQKILGTVRGGSIDPAPFPVSAQCHRVNVQDGHLAAVRVKLARPATLDALRTALATFTGIPQTLRLHSAPERPIVVREEPDRPQPRLDRGAGAGMSVTVGRVFPDRVLDYRFVVLSHNTIRGAAGAALLNAELLAAQGYVG
jgi:aspartate-semialdehyde dehydrogenase